MTSTVRMPTDVMSALLAGFITGEAAFALESITSGGGTHPHLLHPGDLFGRVFAWLWQHDRSQAMMMLGDYLAQLRVHGPGAHKVTPPVSLEELLKGLKLAMPNGFEGFDEVAETAKREVPELYGDPTI